MGNSSVIRYLSIATKIVKSQNIIITALLGIITDIKPYVRDNAVRNSVEIRINEMISKITEI